MIVGIFGTGAIGGSIGLRARRNGDRTIGFDAEPTALEAAWAVGAIDEAVTHDDLIRRSEILVLAAHLQGTLREIERLRDAPEKTAALILDVSSVKAPVMRAARGLSNFVASHPLAGTERSGPAAARADLFDGRPWAYVPSGDTALDARAVGFIRSMGGVPEAVDAEAHDRAVAIASHVPQALAYRYADQLRETEGAERLCGPVARELLRIAAMNPVMWREIFAGNAANVGAQLRRLAARLEAAADEVEGLVE